jgi:hypothetical protein
MPKKIIKKKSSSKKKISTKKKKVRRNKCWKFLEGKSYTQWSSKALRNLSKFNRLPSNNSSGDPFCGHGVPDVCDHKNPITCTHTQFPDNSNMDFYKIAAGLPDPILAAATRGELGAAPAHYSKGKFTPWEVIDDWKLDYYCGNAVKYVCRHKHKGNPVEDIQKAIDCLIKYRDNLKKELGK